MRRFVKPLSLVALFLLVLVSLLNSHAQENRKKELEKKKAKLQREIEQANDMLKETRKSKKMSLTQLATINNKIKKREELIETIESELTTLETQIQENQTQVTKLGSELDQLRAEYARMVLIAWKNRSSEDKLLFIFASRDFNQAVKRIRYFSQYSEFRNRQIEQIEEKKTAINGEVKKLTEKKRNKDVLKTDQEREKSRLTGEKKQKEKMLTDLQKKEKQLKADLKKKQSDATKLNAAIRKIIEEEVRKARLEAEKAAKTAGGTKNTPKSAPEKKNEYSFSLTPESAKLSAGFESNRSRLPWPVSEGVITETFGEKNHPELKGIRIKNNGIDLATKPGAGTRAVFDGEVSGVVTIPGAGKAVIIRHGEYLTVYSNLTDASVKKGDKVKTKQSIGTVITNDENQGELHFEVWKGSVLLNPENWLHP